MKEFRHFTLKISAKCFNQLYYQVSKNKTEIFLNEKVGEIFFRHLRKKFSFKFPTFPKNAIFGYYYCLKIYQNKLF